MNKNKLREFNFVIIANKGVFGLDESFKEYCKKNPSIHCFTVDPSNFDQDVEKLKDIKVEMICLFPFLAKFVPYFMKTFPTFKWIHSLAAGVEGFFKHEWFIQNKEIIVSNSKGAYSEGFGEAGIGSMMYFSYNIPSYIEAMQKKEYTRFNNNMLDNKTLLIVGYGNNGICLAKRAKIAFNIKVIGVLRTMKENFPGKEYLEEVYTMKDLPSEVINRADFVYATLPSTQETINIFNKEFFSKMNKNAVFINVGRGNAVVEDDIIYALENNIIRGAALDVTQDEPIKKDSKLYDISPKKLLLTNHSIGNAGQYKKGCFDCIVENIESYLLKGKPTNVVDKERQY